MGHPYYFHLLPAHQTATSYVTAAVQGSGAHTSESLPTRQVNMFLSLSLMLECSSFP